MNNLKYIRTKNEMSQNDAAAYLNISRRSYQTYENMTEPFNDKYNYLVEKFLKYNFVDEENGILTIDYIKNSCCDIFKKYNIDFCYLFGSYAKNTARGNSDVDLFVNTSITGIAYFGLIEELRIKLSKKIDLICLNQLDNNYDLLREIMKDGIKIYG